MKLIKNYYNKPTPKKWRKLGDALLACALFIGGGGVLALDELKTIYSIKEIKVIIGSVIIVAIIGKFLTNFFSEDSSTEKKNGNN